MISPIERSFDLTFGPHSQHRTWDDRRQLPWARLAQLLTTHGVGEKDGTCIVPAIFSGDSRKKDEARKIEVAFLDSDTGYTLEEIEHAIRERGWRAVISSSFSHLTTKTRASKKNWLRYCEQQGDDADADSLAFGFLHDEKGYLRRVAEGAFVTGMDEGDGGYVYFEHQPCAKFRIAIPLLQPWLAADYTSQAVANATWKACIEALSGALRLQHDQACTDTSRLFFLPRRPPNGPPAEVMILDGDPCDIFTLPPPDAGLFSVETRAATERRKQRIASDADAFEDPDTGEVVELTAWARSMGFRFEIAKALRIRQPGAFVGRLADGVKHHIRCPNEDEHTTPGADGATFVTNASEANNRGFVIHCRHAHCTDRDRLFFLRRMLEQGWLAPDDLSAPEFLVSTDQRPGGHSPGRGAEERPAGRRGERPLQPQWQSPIDFMAEDEKTGVPELQRRHIPDPLWRFVTDTSARMGVDPASCAMFAIATCAAVLTDEWEVQPKRFDDRWTEQPRLWVAVVGDPSVLKSPVLRACTAPVDRMEARAREQNEDALRKHKVDIKAWKDAGSVPADEPQKPRRIRYLAEGTTVEALSELLRTDGEAKFKAPAKKLLVRQDELSEWLANLDRYRSGGGGGSGDRGAYLRLFNGGPYNVDRVIRGAFTIPNWSACILGGIQPDVIRRVAKDAQEDGLLQRFMFCVPGPTQRGLDRTPDVDGLRRYSDLIEALVGLRPATSAYGGAQSVIVLHQDAHKHREGIDDLARVMAAMPDTPGRLKAAYGKWPGMWARLALTFHLIGLADRRLRNEEGPPPQILQEETARMAAAYLEEVLLPHLLRAHAAMYDTPQTGHMRWIAGWILSKADAIEKAGHRITARDVTRAYGTLRAPEHRRELSEVMEGLVTMAWLQPEEPDTPSRERTAWLVNPAVLERFAARGEMERARRVKAQSDMTELVRRRKGEGA